MNTLNKSALFILATTFISNTSQATETDSNLGFKGQGEAGLTDSTGNTTSTSLFAALKLDYLQTDYEVKSTFEVDYKSENSVQTQERYRIASQYNHFYTADHQDYSFAGVKLEKSFFEDIDLDSMINLGYGKKLFEDQKTTFISEISLGQQNTQYATSSSSQNSTQTFAQLSLNIKHTLNEQVSFAQNLTYLSGAEQAKLESDTSFIIHVADNIDLNISYKYRHNNAPAVGIKNTDAQTIMTLAYQF
ncbi:MAG: DUF481 domain-containing protein [Gammaproteobacteria bacterium]|nr:DUF481 domain-containing protein [Gammaproteobacteria bacterium]